MHSPSRTALTILAVATVIATAGCSVDAAAPTPAAKPIPSASTEAAPPAADDTATAPPAADGTGDAPATGTDAAPVDSSDTSDASDASDPTSWTIDFTGVGPLQLGAEFDAARAGMAQFVYDVDLENCPGVGDFTPEAAGIASFITQSVDGAIVSVTLVGRTGDSTMVPATAEGIGVGSSLDDLTAAYPELEQGEFEGTENTYAVAGDAGTYIAFEVNPDDDAVRVISVSDSPLTPAEYCG
ncbi:hypothetical protein [Marisediminicola senii]|uniref:hypothetical protein n=1 Tax=Marisediminicola senii TaxID=2711233 RepID=UPI0013EE2974|nr:hypothetical protein [Marisediminicola senii]